MIRHDVYMRCWAADITRGAPLAEAPTQGLRDSPERNFFFRKLFAYDCRLPVITIKELSGLRQLSPVHCTSGISTRRSTGSGIDSSHASTAASAQSTRIEGAEIPRAGLYSMSATGPIVSTAASTRRLYIGTILSDTTKWSGVRP
jgi:hypothetical protein